MPVADWPTEPIPRVRTRVTQLRPPTPKIHPDYRAWLDSPLDGPGRPCLARPAPWAVLAGVLLLVAVLVIVVGVSA